MCHFPKKPVRYPAACRYCGKNTVPGGVGTLLSTTPWLCMYWPVNTEARLGEQSEVVTIAFSKYTPSRAIPSMAGVSTQGCPRKPITS